MNLGVPKFTNNKDLFAYLKANKENIFEIKKQAKKFTDNAYNFYDDLNRLTNKSVEQKEIEKDYINKAIVGNTYYWLDSHSDVHVKGCFTKSINERRSKVMHLHDHELKITSQVGVIEQLEEIDVNWRSLGVNEDGKTIALVAQSKVKKDYNPMVFGMYKENLIQQHSVGMFYVKVELAVNSDDKEYIEEKELWNEIYPMLGNKEEADKKGYFFVIKEAKLLEISAVPYGSNSITPAYDNLTDLVENEPTKSLEDKTEPPLGTQNEKVQENTLVKDFVENFKL